MSAFFIPGTGEDHKMAERAYSDMRDALELELGTRPSAKRIVKLWTRRGSTDCITEVGAPDPLRGGVVLAIFDMGNMRPFVVWWQPHGGGRTGVWEILSHHAYTVEEFD